MDTAKISRPARAGLILSGAVALAIIALIGTLTGNPGPSPSAGPGGSFTAGTPTTGAPAPQDWAELTLPPDTAVADLQPTRPLGKTVATTSSFSIHALGSIAAVDLASAVSADPPVTFTVEPGATAADATITPTAALAPGVRYRFRVEAPDGSLAGLWTFRTASPLHVVGRLPDNQSTNVPLTTGIETTFDQDGSTDFAAHFKIEPAVAGRFEQHDRTWVFVPQRPLAAATIYTVTISHGVSLEGSNQVLETDVRWQFETASTGSASGARLTFQRPVLEVRPGQAVALAVSVQTNEDGTSAISSTPYELYALPTLDSASAAALKLLGRPSWAEWPASQLVDTSKLRRVAAGTAPLTLAIGLYYGIDSLQLPVKPDPGWYLINLPNGDQPAQAVLQVTDLAGYVLTSQTRTTAWVNDLAGQSPVAGATVAISGGPSLGHTGSDGLATAATPASLINVWSDSGSWAPHLLTITAPDGRVLLAPLGMDGGGSYPADDNRGISTGAGEGFWLLLATDRSMLRQSDTIHTWGVAKARRDGSVPKGLELRLAVPDQSGAPIVRAAVTASARGVFSGDLTFRDLPTGQYEVSLYAGDELLRSTWVEVAVIRKPAYSISVTTDRHAYTRGDAIAVSGDVAFYDGSHAPGLSLIAGYDYTNGLPTVTTTSLADGTFKLTLPGAWDRDWGTAGFVSTPVGVRASGPEEGAIAGSRQVAIFPSSVWLDATATVANGRLQLTGRLTSVDFAKVEAEMAAGQWPSDPSGAALSGRTVTARVIHHVPVKTQIGTSYDFITKQVRPLYQYTDRAETMTTPTLTAGSDGRFTLDIAVPVAGDQYEIDLTAKDSKGRVATAQAWAGQWTEVQNTRPYLVAAGGCGYGTQLSERVGATTNLTVFEGDGTVAGEGRYLFLVGEDGLVSETIQSSSTYQRTFGKEDLPSYSVRAVRLTQQGYDATMPVLVRVDPASKTLGVSVTSLASKYAPGDTASVRIRTTDPGGHPVSADVIVRAVDEKLFTIGAAVDVDAIAELLAPRDSGFLQSYTSHPTPSASGDGCGGTGGREDFRDSATFQHVRTDANGVATVSFKLPDDLTSWHVTATAVSGALDAGSGSALVPVGLPFFVDAIIAPEYLAGDVPAILVRAYGDAVTLNAPVRFVIRAPDLGIDALSIDGRVGVVARAQLKALTPGDYRVTIEGYAKSGTLTDTLIRTIHVVPTRLKALRITQQALATWTTGDGGSGLTSYLVTDAGRASLLPILRDVLAGDGARFDQAAAAELARRLLIDEFDVPASSLPSSTFDRGRYTRAGVTLLPYSSADVTLTALAAVATPELIDVEDAKVALDEWLANDTTRERTLIALAAKAALGLDVLDQLRALAADDLTIREQTWLGIGYLAMGDETSARAVERAILAKAGQRFDQWVRLAGPSSEATLEATALMLVLSGGLGDPLAAGMARYVASQPSTEQIFSLQLLSYVRGGLDRLTRTAASFVWTLDGTRHEQSIEPGGSFVLTVTSDQRSSLRFERLAGDPVVTTQWTGDATTAELPATPGLSISRTVTPAEGKADGIVTVQLTISLSGTLPVGSYNVTDLLPSGLAPLTEVPGWSDDPEVPRDALAPYSTDGQRVSWMIGEDMSGPVSPTRTIELAYRARVVTPGTYRWEPAVIQSTIAPSLGASTPASTYVIR